MPYYYLWGVQVCADTCMLLNFYRSILMAPCYVFVLTILNLTSTLFVLFGTNIIKGTWKVVLKFSCLVVDFCDSFETLLFFELGLDVETICNERSCFVNAPAFWRLSWQWHYEQQFGRVPLLPATWESRRVGQSQWFSAFGVFRATVGLRRRCL